MDITQIVLCVIGLLSAVITVFVIPYIKSKTTANQQSIIQAVVSTAVLAAQQLLTSDTNKKEYAMDYVKSTLSKYGITLNEKDISDAIEAAVKEIKINFSDTGKW